MSRVKVIKDRKEKTKKVRQPLVSVDVVGKERTLNVQSDSSMIILLLR